MKIVYIANIRLPTEKAHGVQIMKMCEAFALLGHDIELVVPDRESKISEDPFSYYGLTKHFPIHRLPVSDTIGGYGAFGFLVESLSFVYAVRRYLRDASFDVLYGRDEHILACLPGPFVWESHTGAWNSAARIVARRARRLVVISHGLKALYVAKGIPTEKIAVAHDGVDLEDFAHPQSKREARIRLNLPLDTKIALYIGRLDGWKGVETLLEASNLFASDVVLAVMGGEAAQVEKLSRQYPLVRFLGFHPYRELPDNMAAADVLVLPNTGKSDVSARFTSPLKLFAYMASGVPIVASDLPSIREVLDEQSAFFFTPDDATALATSVHRALENGSAQAKHARSLVEEYTWRHRAEYILAACASA
ncbi:MAG: glycosyltransferase family 4 protein [Patescibacteria group bacterium]